MVVPPAATARARVRAEITTEILEAAGSELAAEGPTALSIRAVARRVGMVPSAIYRYFPSRDALLTALIVSAYESVGEAAEAADRLAAAAGEAPLGRWMAVTAAVRDWARAQPHRWALIYGTPVPGYAAPPSTVESAMRVVRVLSSLVPPGAARGGEAPAVLPPAPPGLGEQIGPLRDEMLPGRLPEAVVAALMAWTSLVGMVTMELFGHFEGATTGSFEAVFAYAMEGAGRMAGLASA